MKEEREIQLEESWKEQLRDFFETDEWKKLRSFVREAYLNQKVYPHPTNIFSALNRVPFDKVSVVILGQDPYHNPGQAHGLAFSVPRGTNIPPSLQNIYREIENNLKKEKDYSSGDLSPWAEQGVLLLNSVLTVEKNKPGSHADKGWELFTDEIIRKLSQKRENLVFLLWGNYAQKKGGIIDRSKHLVLHSPHPSPLSAHRGFFGNKHFSQTNDYLKKHGKRAIDW